MGKIGKHYERNHGKTISTIIFPVEYRNGIPQDIMHTCEHQHPELLEFAAAARSARNATDRQYNIFVHLSGRACRGRAG